MSTTTTIQYAPLWRRFAAIVYDTLLVTAVSMGYGAVGVALTHSLSGGDAVETSNHFHWAFQFGWLFVVIAFFCFFCRRCMIFYDFLRFWLSKRKVSEVIF